MPDLPNDGDFVQFDETPAGALVRQGVVYRVEKKPLETEYLLIDTLSGHAGRVTAGEFKAGKWKVAEVPKPEVAGRPFATATEPEEVKPSGGILDMEPLR
jgi:hypothetical protein